MMRKYWAVLFSLLFLGVTPNAEAEDFTCGEFSISFDFSAINALIPLLQGEGDEDDIEAALALNSVSAIVRKQAQYHDDSTLERFREELMAHRAGEPVEDAIFPFPDDAGLRAIAVEAARLQADPSALMSPACARLSTYLPAHYDQDLHTVFVIGVSSAGFTFGDPVLHIGFHRMFNDLAGMELVMVHELYHGAQGAYRPVSEAITDRLTETERRALNYLQSGYQEGSASWVADAASFEGDGAMLEFFQTRLERGLNERGNLFTLFEASLFQLANDPTTNPQRHYFAGFTGEERNYNVGYIIAREIESHYGRERLAQLMTEPPTAFYRLYADIDGASGPKLTESFLGILSDLERALEDAGSGSAEDN